MIHDEPILTSINQYSPLLTIIIWGWLSDSLMIFATSLHDRDKLGQRLTKKLRTCLPQCAARWGPQESVQLPYKWLKMVDITIVNGGYFMVYKPTTISGGPHPVETGRNPKSFWEWYEKCINMSTASAGILWILDVKSLSARKKTITNEGSMFKRREDMTFGKFT